MVHYCAQKISANNVLKWTFCTFFNGFELGIEFCLLWYPCLFKFCKIKFFSLSLHFLLTLKPNWDEKAQKTKNVFYKCISVLCKKYQNRCTLLHNLFSARSMFCLRHRYAKIKDKERYSFLVQSSRKLENLRFLLGDLFLSQTQREYLLNRVERFLNNLVLPGRWWLQKFYSKTHL